MTKSIIIPDKVKWHPAVWWSRFKCRWPFLIWLLAVGGALFLFAHGGQFAGMAGVVDADREQVAPLETARLKEVLVKIGQRVNAGDVLARMDTSLLDTELAMEQLRTDLRFANAVFGLQGDLRDVKIRWAEDRAALETLTTEIERMDVLLEKHLIEAQDVTRLRVQQQSLAAVVALYPDMAKELEQELAEANRRSKTMDVRFGSLADAADGWLSIRRNTYVLRARFAGLVVSINHEPGEVISAGEGVVTLLTEGTTKVVGYVPETNINDIHVGMTVYLARTSGGEIIPANVVALVPEVMGLPNRLSAFQGQTLRGQRAILVPEQPYPLVPGESITIQLQKPLHTLLAELFRKQIFARGH